MNRKDAAKHFEAFSTTTVIRIFNFIRTSQFRFERLFWIAVLIGFTAATIVNVTATFDKFYSEPTASQVSIVANDTSGGLVFPNAVICLQLLGASLLDLYESKVNESIAIVKNTPNLLKSLRNTIDRYHELEQQIASDMHASLKNATTADEKYAVMGLYHQPRPDFFSEDEIALIGLTMLIYWRVRSAEMNRTVQLTWKAEKLLPLYQAYIERKIDFDELFLRIMEASCVLLQIRVIRSNLNIHTTETTSFTYSACKQWKVHFFGIYFGGQEMTCFRVEEDSPFVFNTAFDDVTLTLRSDWLAKNFAPQTQIQIDLMGAFTVFQQQKLLASFSARQSMTFSVETVSHLLNLRRRSCAAKWARKGFFTQCSWWCTMESVMWNCGCTPLWRHFLPQFVEVPMNLPSCALNMSLLVATPKCVADVTAEFQCSQRCVKNCETAILSNVVYVGDPVLNYINSTPAIRLFATKFVYEQIDEYITTDAKALVAALGGNLSLFLGASFLALIHILVFVVRIPFQLVYQQEVALTAAGGPTAD